VIFQVGVFAEPSVTDVTLERPRPVVHVHVRFQVAGRRERFGAQRAFVRFFLRTHVTNINDVDIIRTLSVRHTTRDSAPRSPIFGVLNKN